MGDTDSGVRFIWLKPGYVESSKTGWLIYGCARDSSYNREEAIFSLAEELYKKYMQSHQCVLRDCCRSASETARYCSLCGRCIAKFEFDADQFKDWLCTLSESDINGYGYDEDMVWRPWHPPKEILGIPISQQIFLSHYGDLAILYALHLNPRIDWHGNFSTGGCWTKEYLERHWAVLMETGEWALG